MDYQMNNSQQLPQASSSTVNQDLSDRESSPPYHPADLGGNAADDVIIEANFEASPVIVNYPDMLSTGKADSEVQRYVYRDFPSPVAPDVGMMSMGRLQHMSLRYWVNFTDEYGAIIPRDQEPDFENDPMERNKHTETLRQLLVAENVAPEAFVEGMVFYYGRSTPRTHDSGGRSIAEARQQPGRTYIDIRLPFWKQSIAEKMVEERRMFTDRTSLLWLGPAEGRGPIAPPQYAISLTTVPARFEGYATATSMESFLEQCMTANKCFIDWRDRHQTGHEIVAWGGFFENGDLEADWDYRMFAIYKVPVAPDNRGSSDVADYRKALEEYTPFTVFGRVTVRNSFPFRKACPECKFSAKYIHGLEGHICASCNQEGHLRRTCTTTRRPTATKRRHDQLTSFMAKPNRSLNVDHIKSLNSDPEMLAYEQQMSERRSKRARHR